MSWYRRPLTGLVLALFAGAIVGVLIGWLLAVTRERPNLPVFVVGGPFLAAVIWAVWQRSDLAESPNWPAPIRAPRAARSIHDDGVARLASTLASADFGSAMSSRDVALAVTSAAAARLVERGADPADPLAHAEDAYSKNLATFCRRTAAGDDVGRLSRRTLDSHLKEIVSL